MQNHSILDIIGTLSSMMWSRRDGDVRGEFISGADHMGANEAVPTAWDPDSMV